MSKLIECKRTDLLAALKIVLPAIEQRSTLPILSNVLLRANKKIIEVIGTDLDVTVKCKVVRTGPDKSPIAMTIPARLLYDFVNAAGLDDLWITLDSNGEASMHAGAARTLHTLPVTDFPIDRKYDTPARFSTDIGTMLTALATVKPAISIEETRYYLNGVFFEPLGTNKMAMVATDGHRLHTINIVADGLSAINTATNVIVPTKTIHVLEKWLQIELRTWAKRKEPSPTFSVEMGSLGINFHFGTTTMRSRVIDGTYPDWRRVIPKRESITNVGVFDAKVILAAMKQVKPGRGDDNKPLKLTFTKDKCTLSRSHPVAGKISIDVECGYTGEIPFEIGVNHYLLTDALNTLGDKAGAVISMAMSDAGSPIRLREVAVQNPFVILMPMRV